MKPKINISANMILIAAAAICLIPFVLLVSSSFTDEAALLQNGYSFFPGDPSLAAYEYLWETKDSLLKAYGISIVVTVIGTFFSLLITATYAYAISLDSFPYRKLFTGLVIVSVLFNPGLVPSFLVYTRYLSINNTIFALIVPRLLLSGMNVFIMRSYFKNSIPLSLLEAAKLDGASELKVFFRIVVPVAKPIFATIGFLNGIAYWNDWYNSFIYINDSTKLSLQGLLNQIIRDIQFLSSTDFAGNVAAANVPSVSVRMAIAVIAILPTFIAFPFFQKFLVKGVSIGAVKG